jgi:hypothetical protein
LCAVKEDAAPAAPEEREFDLRAARAAVLGMLGDTQKEYAARLAAIRAAYGLPSGLDAEACRTLLAALEYLDEGHRALLCALDPHYLPQGKTATPCERFCAYLIYRHTGNAQDLQEFRSGVAYALLLQHLLGALIAQHGYSPVRAAVLLSEELEYSEENESAIRFALELQMK